MTNLHMITVLQRIDELKDAYARLPFFEFLRDESVDAADRIAFFPCMAHFILSFGDLNKYILRAEPTHDVRQKRINAHTYEDDHHWPWYLEDLEKLGFNQMSTPTTVMNFLWGDKTRMNRILMYRLTAIIDQVDSVERLAIIEAIEETGTVLFREVLGIARILEARIGGELRYCGSHHFGVESGHVMGADHCEIAGIQLDQAKHDRCVCLVEAVFELFALWTDELLRFAKSHKEDRLASMRLHSNNNLAPCQ